MHAHLDSPFHHLHWTAGQLADAVPLRLHQMPLFVAGESAAPAAANHEGRRPSPASYLPAVPMAEPFRVR